MSQYPTPNRFRLVPPTNHSVSRVPLIGGGGGSYSGGTVYTSAPRPTSLSSGGGGAGADGGGGGGDDPDNDPTPQPPQEKKRRKKKKIKKVIPSSFEVPIWGTFHVNSSRFYIGVYSISVLLSIAFVIGLWVFQKIPTLPLPLVWYRYCALYYIALIPFYIVNLFFPLNIMVNAIYTGYALLHTLIFSFESWLLGCQIYFWWQCAVGALPSTCGASYWTDLVMVILTGIIWVGGLRSMVYLWNVSFRTSGVSQPTLIEYQAEI
jgi:hypothetical protein